MIRRARFAVAAVVMAGAACGGGGGPSDDATRAGRLLLGLTADDEGTDDLDCVAEAVDEALSGDVLEVAGSVDDLADLDIPTRERLFSAALQCVPPSQLG